MTDIKSNESYKEIDISGEFRVYPDELFFCKEALESGIESSDSLTIYLPPLNIITGANLLAATRNASRFINENLRYVQVDEIERGNTMLQARRDNAVYDFEYTVPKGVKASLLSFPTGYVRAANIEAEASLQFTVGAINFEAAEFTAIQF